MLFCPTGGLDVARARVYLRLPNVACVGGTWLVRRWDIENRDWARISELAHDAAGLRTEAL